MHIFDIKTGVYSYEKTVAHVGILALKTAKIPAGRII